MQLEATAVITRWLLVVASLLGAAGVGIGAYAAHGLETSLTAQDLPVDQIAKRVEQAETGVRYHLTHTLVLLTLALTGYGQRSRLVQTSVMLMIAGIALFSGVLYLIAIVDSTLHWLVPIGGLAFMVGWVLLAASALTRSIFIQDGAAASGSC